MLQEMGDISIYTASDEFLRSLTGYALTRGVLCAMRRPAGRAAGEMIRTSSRLVLLEDILDGTNIGTIFRCAAGLGMDGVLLTRGCCDPYTRRSVRVSMGGVFKLPFACVKGDDILEILRENGYHRAGMVLSPRAISLRDFHAEQYEKLCVLFGTEATGLRPETIAACDTLVTIPMASDMDSLNVSASASIAFWEMGRGG